MSCQRPARLLQSCQRGLLEKHTLSVLLGHYAPTHISQQVLEPPSLCLLGCWGAAKPPQPLLVVCDLVTPHEGYEPYTTSVLLALCPVLVPLWSPCSSRNASPSYKKQQGSVCYCFQGDLSTNGNNQTAGSCGASFHIRTQPTTASPPQS